jgi:hypothetical protein
MAPLYAVLRSLCTKSDKGFITLFQIYIFFYCLDFIANEEMHIENKLHKHVVTCFFAEFSKQNQSVMCAVCLTGVSFSFIDYLLQFKKCVIFSLKINHSLNPFRKQLIYYQLSSWKLFSSNTTQ